MTVRVLLFSLLREIVGRDEISMSLQNSEASVADLLSRLFAEHPGLIAWDEKMLIAVNCEYADRDQSLEHGDEVALMPPVQGG